MRSIAISPDQPSRPCRRRVAALPLGPLGPLGLFGLLVLALAPAAANAVIWPEELGQVLSWTPPASTAGDLEDCTLVVDRLAAGQPSAIQPSAIQTAVDEAEPGDVLCVRSPDHQDELVRVTRSGAPGAPIELRALGRVVTGGFIVEADDILIRGFTVDNDGVPFPGGREAGFHLAGARLGILDNLILDPGGYGIHCHLHAPRCEDTAIIGNTVRGVDGIGINAMGRNLLVEGNDVAGSFAREAGDADGMRFFGERILIRRNYVHHISDRGYPEGEEPHTDCFQTFDSGRPSTRDVVIEDNVCVAVDHQCLMAEAPLRQEGARLIFRRNICANSGSQGVLIRDFADPVIEGNVFLPSIYYHGIVLRQNVTGAVIDCNLVVGRPALHEIDETSRSGLGLDEDGNRRVADPAEAGAAHAALVARGCALPRLEGWLALAGIPPATIPPATTDGGEDVD